MVCDDARRGRVPDRRVLALAVLLGAAFPGCSARRDALSDWLERPLLTPGQPLAEVRAFLAARVPPAPAPIDAAAWQRESARLRVELLDEVVLRGEARSWSAEPLRWERVDAIDGGPGYTIEKLRFEAVPGLWVPALLYRPEEPAEPTPIVLDLHGHYAPGVALDYEQLRAINLAKRGLFALSVGWLGTTGRDARGDDHDRLTQLDLSGTSGLAPFYLLDRRALELALSIDGVDPARVAAAGLSGGGWQTLILAALDERVAAANPIAGYEAIGARLGAPFDLGDSEQLASDLGERADYTHLTALVAPRALLLTYNAADDCCFVAGRAIPSLWQSAAAVWGRFRGAELPAPHVNLDPGTHNLGSDNRERLYRFLGERFFPGDARWDAREIPSEDELKSAEELAVPLPPDGLDLHGLALQLAEAQPEAELPERPDEARSWIARSRRELAHLARVRTGEISAEHAGGERDGALRATFWRLRTGGFTLPAVEIEPPEAVATALVVGDAGRAAATDEVRRLLERHLRVVTVDPFALGESAIEPLGGRYAEMAASLGERPLGIQAGQIASVARWLGARNGRPPLVVALGPRAALSSLVASAVEPEAVAGLELYGALATLKQAVEQDRTALDAPELFCFGLLEKFDVRTLAALSAPRPVAFVSPDGRLPDELSGLHAFRELVR
jgi:hypothetical protein